MDDGIAIIKRVVERQALVKVLDRNYLDLTTPTGKGILAFLSALAEDERLRILRRANEGRVEARKKGVHMGRKPKLTDHQQDLARERMAKGDTCRAIAKDLGVHHSTVSRLAG
jgi:DNA invertase Pin-like site-specific DNA recombinase